MSAWPAAKGKGWPVPGRWGSDDWSWGTTTESTQESDASGEWGITLPNGKKGGKGVKGKLPHGEDQKVFVGNLPKTATKETLQDFFGQFDTVLDVHNVVDEDRMCKGFAFIAFEHLATVDHLTRLEAPLMFQDREIIIKKIFKPGEPKGKESGGKGKEGGKKGGCRFQSNARIFVGGLPDAATPDKVKKHFEQYGTIIDVHIKLAGDGTSRGFGFITFENEAVAEYVKMNAANTQFEGHWIVCKAGGDKQQYYGGQRVFLGGLPKSTTPGAVNAYFSQFGVITNVDLKYDQQGVFRNFGFIIFRDKDVADRVCLEQHALDGKQIDVKMAMDHDGTFKAERDKGKGGANPNDLMSALALAGGSPLTAGGDALASLGLAGVDPNLLALASMGGMAAASSTATSVPTSLGGVAQPGYGVSTAGTIDPNLLALASLSGMGGAGMANAATLAATYGALAAYANPTAAAAATSVAGVQAGASAVAPSADPAAQMAELASQAAQFADHASQVAAQAAAQAAQMAADPTAQAAQLAAPTAQVAQLALADTAAQAAQLTAPAAQATQLVAAPAAQAAQLPAPAAQATQLVAAPAAQATQLVAQATQLVAQTGTATQLTDQNAQLSVPAAPALDPAVLAALGLGGDQAGAASFGASFGAADANTASVRAAPY